MGAHRATCCWHSQNMSSDRMLREYDHAMFLQQPKLPAHLDGDIHAFDFASDTWHAAAWFFCLLDELQSAHDKTPTTPGSGFIHSRCAILKAWHEHRLHGLCMSETDSIRKHCRDGENLFMTNTTFGTIRHIFPVFCILRHAGNPKTHNSTTPQEEEDESCIECLWVADRARRIGLGQRMVAEMDCAAVEIPIARDFWYKMGYTVDISLGAVRKPLYN